MPTDIHAVLLIPHEGDPHGLLRRGPHGFVPPTYVMDFGPEGDGTLVLLDAEGREVRP